MKNLITAAIIAFTATTAHADTARDYFDREKDKVSAIKCVKDHFEKRSHEYFPSDAGYRNIELAADLYQLSYVWSGIEKYEAKAEASRQFARDFVKENFGRYGWAGEINYCFRQHMGE